jgi:hypothetical protein
MKYRRRGFEEAKAEALRIAEAFVAAGAAEGDRWGSECSPPKPDQEAPGFDRRKPVTRWIVWVRPVPPVGCVIDGGDAWVLVDLESKEARWKEWGE